MEFRELIRIGVKSLFLHKLRTLLTMLGVIFGVGAVIAMMSIGEGARRKSIEQIRLLGTNNIRIKQLTLDGDEAVDAEFRNSEGLSWQDARSLRDKVAGSVAISEMRYVDEVVMAKGAIPKGVNVVGVSSTYDDLTNSFPSDGRFLSLLDDRSAARVCVMGNEIKREIFGVQSAVGQTIRIGEDRYAVIGVMPRKNVSKGGSSVIELRNINRDIYIPITTALKRFTDPDFPNQIDEIAIQIDTSQNVVPASKLIHRILDRRHNGAKDFEIMIPDELLAQSQRTQRIFNVVMGSIAALSLLVGGIGIMNIMLANVTERTKEIGIRRALGASERDILGQFLNETLLISITGGLIGILIGAGMALAINVFAKWDTVVSPLSILVSFGISATVGVVFGLYPAQQAAQKDPIEALRYE
jgi:putative ABC transport system permease protein